MNQIYGYFTIGNLEECIFLKSRIFSGYGVSNGNVNKPIYELKFSGDIENAKFFIIKKHAEDFLQDLQNSDKESNISYPMVDIIKLKVLDVSIHYKVNS